MKCTEVNLAKVAQLVSGRASIGHRYFVETGWECCLFPCSPRAVCLWAWLGGGRCPAAPVSRDRRAHRLTLWPGSWVGGGHRIWSRNKGRECGLGFMCGMG